MVGGRLFDQGRDYEGAQEWCGASRLAWRHSFTSVEEVV
jgi:hypothetical protein